MSEYTLDWLIGDEIASVVAEEFERWLFKFASGGTLSVQCPWRVMEDEAIRLSSADHHQQYGLPAPIDAAAELHSLLQDDRVKAVKVDQKCGDLLLTFRSMRQLQVVPFSRGYEAWESLSPQGFNVFAQGGQQLSGFRP